MDSHEDYATLANGEVMNVWSVGVPTDKVSDFKEICLEDALKNYSHCLHGAHGMIYSFSDEVLWKKFKRFANVLMQVRNEGNLGFGGGLVDAGEQTIHALNREFHEEFGVDEDKCQFEEADHLMSVVNEKKRFVSHFYAKELSNEVFEEVEKGALKAKDWSTETMGILRVPLYVMDDGLRGLPTFLAHQFAGFAREQLLETLKRRRILPSEDLQRALHGYQSLLNRP